MLRYEKSRALVQGAQNKISAHRRRKYGMSRGEYASVKKAVGGMDKLFDEKSKAYEQQFIKYLAHDEDKEEKLFEHPELFKTPIVRNGRQATVGYCPEIWKDWE